MLRRDDVHVGRHIGLQHLDVLVNRDSYFVIHDARDDAGHRGDAQHCPDEFHVGPRLGSERCFFAGANIADIRFIHHGDDIECIFLNYGDEGGEWQMKPRPFPPVGWIPRRQSR